MTVRRPAPSSRRGGPERRRTLLKVSVPPGSAIPAKVHTHEDEAFHIVEGAAEFLVGAERVDARAGATVLGPRGKRYGYKATSLIGVRHYAPRSPSATWR